MHGRNSGTLVSDVVKRCIYMLHRIGEANEARGKCNVKHNKCLM